MKQKIIWILIGVSAVMLVGFVVFVATGSSGNLDLIEARFAKDELGQRVLIGAVQNNINRGYGEVQVQIELFNGSGDTVDMATASIDFLEAGKIWQFKVPVTNAEVVEFKAQVTSPYIVRPARLGSCSEAIC